MTSESPPNSTTPRSFSLSIGQLTFGSFMLVLAVIIITSTASVIAIRHIDSTFVELQRLQSVGDLAEDIDRRMNELRLAARDFVTDPGTQSVQVGEAATALGEVLKKTRIELAPEQQEMIDGVTERKRGIFYRKSQAMLHFHEDPAGFFADLRLPHGWTRLPVNTAAERRRLLSTLKSAIGS